MVDHDLALAKMERVSREQSEGLALATESWGAH
jgi:hypothetical protein